MGRTSIPDEVRELVDAANVAHIATVLPDDVRKVEHRHFVGLRRSGFDYLAQHSPASERRRPGLLAHDTDEDLSPGPETVEVDSQELGEFRMRLHGDDAVARSLQPED